LEQPSAAQSLKVVVAHRDRHIVEVIQQSLATIEHELIGPCDSSQELRRKLQEQSIDLAITGVDLSDGNGLDALVEIAEINPTPAIIIARQTSLEHVQKALQDHVMAYLVEPIEKDDLVPTVYLVLERFRQFQQLRQEADSLRSALDDRKLVERAKGILMASESLSEADAHRMLQKRAKDKRLKLRQIAAEIIAAQERAVKP
jgi:AmiR/NasT family two-component response regulator